MCLIWAHSEKRQEQESEQEVRTEVGVVLYARGRACSRGVVRAGAAVGRVGCIARQKPTRQIDIRCVWEGGDGEWADKQMNRSKGRGSGDRHAPGLSRLATQALLHPTGFPDGSSGPTSC